MKPMLQTDNLAIGYKQKEVAANLNLSLLAGEMVCLIGPNGAGKSTLIRTLAGMQAPLDGQVLILGDDVQYIPARLRAQRLSVVLTERIEAGMLSGYGLVALGRHPYTDWTGNLSPQDEDVIRWAVAAVGAEDIAPRAINTLSDGERQKLMIARALAQEPAVMILDEPTAFLDLPRRVEILMLLRQIARDTNRAILLSTHDLDLALRSADRIWLMPKDAALQVGAPEDLVLNGAFEQAFASEGVQFDVNTGSFKPRTAAVARVAVSGEGLALVWLQRALVRNGYQIDATSDVHIQVMTDSYRLTQNQTTTTYNDMYSLLQRLNERSSRN